MSREKKTKTGINGDLVFARKHNRKNDDVEGRERKKLKKRKGLKTGSRNSESKQEVTRQKTQQRDPRLGSKKKIELVVDAPKKQTKQQRMLSAEKELEMLENDAQLNVLLERLDNGESLGAGLQKLVDEKLDRIEKLMKQLGIYEEDDDQQEDELEAEEISVPKTKAKKKAASEDELLSQFEDLDLNDFKG
ncbi:hypothetical protein SAMN04488136_11947 [Vibrio xiamenensis]|uniref:Der GTPase-activating protein YihI n=1 Tax=Vibrio xiamenensis TaxID=861298 RepID=A0A1G8DBR9_9VIBR|nr:Der GTPase-activating protein YihI [Vibrio xiamenensis]SDH55152.1 hypothetical protein SAMN04488136_11947 [Vibrio xiamenensis]